MPFKFCFCGKAEKEFYHVLDYSHKNLLNVPTEIYEHAQTLEDLYLDANQLKDLPKALFTLQHLKVLNICDNEIISLPSNVSNLVHLVEFDISKNGFLELPDNIKGMKSLEHFDLSVNPLGRLPDGFTMLLNLTHVYLNDTFLDFLPANIGRMAKLEVLEVRDNHLTMIPKSMSRLQSLRRLDLGNNEFNDMPEVVGTFANLEELWLDGNKIKNLPPEIGNLKRLRYLDITENTLEWVADEIGECISMTDLHFSTNNLETLPENLCKLKLLETLKIDDNRLRVLPTSIGGLSNLEEFICSSNELITLPPGIGLLRKLKTLNADENYIEELPEEIGSCVSLTVVSLRQNRLIHLPDEIGWLANLAVFNISSNMLENLPYTLMKLKKLKALWLSENQAKPLIPLQTDCDEANERSYLTCYMFPQRPSTETYEETPSLGEQQENINQSLLEEEWKKRTSVVFDLEDDDPQVVRLSRQPTPFPKDVRDKINQFRNQAIAKGHVSNHHPVGEHVKPQHPYQPADEIEQKRHGHPPPSYGHVMNLPHEFPVNGHHEPYTGHPEHPTHATEEEKMLLEQLKNSSLHPGGGQQAGTSDHMNSKFSIPVVPSPISSRRYDDGYDGDNVSVENIHLSVGDSKKNIKLSSDSGLGSSELGEEHQHWKNEYPAIPEQEEVFRVTIKKTPHFGFSLSGGVDSPTNPMRPNDTSIYITRVMTDGPAALHLQPGDKILEVNGNDFRNMEHEKAVKILKACDEVNLLVSRRINNDKT